MTKAKAHYARANELQSYGVSWPQWLASFENKKNEGSSKSQCEQMRKCCIVIDTANAGRFGTTNKAALDNLYSHAQDSSMRDNPQVKATLSGMFDYSYFDGIHQMMEYWNKICLAIRYFIHDGYKKIHVACNSC